MELELRNIKKTFHSKIAIQHLNVRMETGIIALLGANGCGKTTLLRMLVGNLKPDEGEILWDGQDIQKNYEAYVTVLGYMPQHLGMYPNFTVLEFLSYMALLKGLKKTFTNKKIISLVKELNLFDVRNKKIKHLSGGMLRRVGIAQALLNNPKMLILDEPTAGLDPKERNTLKNIISHLSKNCLIILSTHIVSDIESIADDVLVLKEGKLLMQGSPAVILKKMKHKVYEIYVNKEETQDIEDFTIINYRNLDNQQIYRVVSDEMPYDNAYEVEPTLEDLYMYYFKEDGTL